MSGDLIHWHKIGDEPSTLAAPPGCCAHKLNAVLDQVLSERDRHEKAAVLAERRRVVVDSLHAISAYAEGACSIADEATADLVRRITDHCAGLVRAVGCICPRFDVSGLGGQHETIPGSDPRCGVHTQEQRLSGHASQSVSL